MYALSLLSRILIVENGLKMFFYIPAQRLGNGYFQWALVIALVFIPASLQAANFKVSTKMQQATKNSMFIYEKSNLDGSNKGYIAVYYPEAYQIESFKWHKGNNAATIVKASLSPKTINAERFEAYRVRSNGEQIKTATLSQENTGQYQVKLGGNESIVSLPNVSWHSYDFDFASLGYAFRFLADKRTPYTFNVFDLDLTQNPPVFSDFGTVTLSYEKDAIYSGQQSLQYKINGNGLDDRGGQIWFDAAAHHLVGFEIQKPDEPGYTSGKLRLVEKDTLTHQQWREFKIRALAENE